MSRSRANSETWVAWISLLCCLDRPGSLSDDVPAALLGQTRRRAAITAGLFLTCIPLSLLSPTAAW